MTDPKPKTSQKRQGKRAKVTNDRHSAALAVFNPEAQKLVDTMRKLSCDEKNRGFEIGDIVEQLTTKYRITVKALVEPVGLSRSRLCDCRITAKAFKKQSERERDLPFHYFTLAARAAQRQKMTAPEMLEIVLEQEPESVKDVSRVFAELQRRRDNGKALERSSLLIAKHGDLLNRCHHDDFRNVIPRLDDGSIKLVIADPPYDGKRQCTTSATVRTIDSNTEIETCRAITDLLKLLVGKMAPGGTLIIFRPGAAMDPPWLPNIIKKHGWECAGALTWNKHKVKLGRTDSPYGIATERLLVITKKGDRLVNHNDSSRDDVLDFSAIQPRRADGGFHHQHEKPIDLLKHLVGKHTHEGELVVEPFGGTGPACRAAAELGRHWLYSETNETNFKLGTTRIAESVVQQNEHAG